MSEKTKKKRTRKYVPRNTIQFQMNLRNEVDLEVLKIHEWAASNGKAVQMFRDGFRLMNALQQGDTALLFSLFPDLDGTLKPHDENLIETFRAMLKSEIKLLPATVATAPAQAGGLKPLGGAHQIAMPDFSQDEDDDADNITIVHNPKANEQNMLNFLKSVQGIN